MKIKMSKLNFTIGFICFCLSMLIICSNLKTYGSEAKVQNVAVYTYDAAGKRDPFMPLVTKEGRLAFTYGAVRSLEDIRLEGIVYDPGGDSIAIINGLVLKENDTLGNIKVVKIDPDKVILLFNQAKQVIRLEE